MEDEYICVDDLHERLGGAPNFPSPGAFYGVAYFLLFRFIGSSIKRMAINPWPTPSIFDEVANRLMNFNFIDGPIKSCITKLRQSVIHSMDPLL